MPNEIAKTPGGHASPFERIKRTNSAGMEFWSSRDFAEVLGYGDYRNFEGVVEKAKLSCFNSGHRIEDHFVDVTEMVAIGSGAVPEELPVAESIKKIETQQRKQLGEAGTRTKKMSE
jgi:hypothetical protein